MPVINFKYDDLCGLLGKKIPQQVLLDKIPMIGSDMGDNVEGDNEMSVEFFPDRPDMFSVEGIARGMRAFLGLETGLKEYPIEPTDMEVTVDASVLAVRPQFMCAVVKDVTVTDEFLRSLMELQEKLHITIGRKRSKFAIGIHDLDKVTPPFTYTTAAPHEVRFVPLAKTEEMDMEEILRKHEKGTAYAHLLKGCDRYPVIFDANGNVVSFPPIINGSLTTVTTSTRNIFVDVTGMDRRTVKGALDIVVTALAERGGTICSVKMRGEEKFISPNLEPLNCRISASEACRFIGTDIGVAGVVEALEKMGMEAKADGDTISVRYPTTRLDILHKVDIFEDVATGYGFEKFGGAYTVGQTIGHLSADTAVSDQLKDIMVGLGFTEVMTLTLSNEKDEFEISGLPEKRLVKVTNPITEDHTCLRAYLMPSLMRILRHNKHRDLPQRIFEVGYVVDDVKNVPHICAMATAAKASFTEIKSLTESFLRETSVKYEIRPCDLPTFIPGRGANVVVGGKVMGWFGEVAIPVLAGFDITHPVIMFEMDVSDLIKAHDGRLF